MSILYDKIEVWQEMEVEGSAGCSVAVPGTPPGEGGAHTVLGGAHTGMGGAHTGKGGALTGSLL